MRTPRRRRCILGRAWTAYPWQMSGVRRTRWDYVGAPAHVPDVRPRRLLRFEPTPTRERTFSHDRPSGDALGRARGGLAVVLHRRPTGL